MNLKPALRLFVFFILLFICGPGCKHQKKQLAGTPIPKTQHASPKDAKQNSLVHKDLREKLKLSERDVRENKLFGFSNEWYGVPYKYGGCSKAGVDCSCFASLLYLQVYKKQLARSASDMFKNCNQLGIEDAKEGDLVFFKIGGKSVSHVGVIIKNRYFIHSSTGKGVILSSLEEAYYKKYFFCAGRVRNS